jgi:hypothetical protein
MSIIINRWLCTKTVRKERRRFCVPYFQICENFILPFVLDRGMPKTVRSCVVLAEDIY